MINGCGEGPEVRGSNPVWSFVDLYGKQFDDTFYMWVLENTVPYIPAVVWHDPAGTIPWTQPIQFLANGTLPIDIYWDPSKFYRLEFRQNVGPLPPSQADPLIYLVENYSPNNAPMNPVGGTGVTTENQITNPQFSVMNSSGTYTQAVVTNPPPIEVAPGWFLKLVGTGGVSISRVPLNTALSNPTNAPYALHIVLTGGWTTNPILYQIFQQNGQNWQGLYLSTSFTARVAGAPANITANVVASNGQPLASLITTTLTNDFVEYSGNALVPTFANLDLPPNAFIEYELLLPPVVDLYITSIQLVASEIAQDFAYEQVTVDSQINGLFHYYKPLLAYKPIPSYLVGWDFPLNPAQIFGENVAAQAVGANKGYYVWDQTIIYQTTNSSVTTARGADGSLQLTCAVPGQVAIIQYLDQVIARKILSDRASVNLSLYGAVAAGAHGNVTLWATTDANLPTLSNTFITAIDANGIPTAFSSVNWVQIPNVYQNTSFTVPAASANNAESNDIMLNGWDMAGAVPTNTATYFAIVVGFSMLAVTDKLNINSIGLCAGDIATRPAPKPQDETLRDCERYYEKSYKSSDVAGTVTNFNALVAPMSSTDCHTVAMNVVANVLENSFGFSYRTLKRIPTTQTYPTVNIYSPATGNSNKVSLTYSGQAQVSADDTVSAVWAVNSIGNKNAYYLVTNPTRTQAITTDGFTPLITWINYHYVVDARLGVVN